MNYTSKLTPIGDNDLILEQIENIIDEYIIESKPFNVREMFNEVKKNLHNDIQIDDYKLMNMIQNKVRF
jgi:hypothetical protein